MTTSLRTRVGAQLDTALRNMQRETDKHDPRALAERAALRQGLQGGFGTAPLADAAVLRILRLPAGEDGEPPAMTPQLQALLEDAVLVASLVAATRVGVRSRPPEDGASSVGDGSWTAPGRRVGSLGNDLRRLKARESGISDRLLTALLGASRDELPRQLRRACSLMASDGAALDVRALVRDLGMWDADDRRVQKRWAYDFWSRADGRGPEQDNDEETA